MTESQCERAAINYFASVHGITLDVAREEYDWEHLASIIYVESKITPAERPIR